MCIRDRYSCVANVRSVGVPLFSKDPSAPNVKFAVYCENRPIKAETAFCTAARSAELNVGMLLALAKFCTGVERLAPAPPEKNDGFAIALSNALPKLTRLFFTRRILPPN